MGSSSSSAAAPPGAVEDGYGTFARGDDDGTADAVDSLLGGWSLQGAAPRPPTPRCLICLEASGVPRAGCGHPFCAPCVRTFLQGRINERAIVDMRCPAAAMIEAGGEPCPAVTRDEVARALSPAWLERYDHFLAAERAERDPSTRWCARPGCATICQPCETEAPFSAGAALVAVASVAGAAAAPYLEPSLNAALGLPPSLAAAATVAGTLGVLAALWHGARRLGPSRQCVCPRGGDAVCYDCKAAWHPGRMCEEVSAQSLMRWCRERDAGQCPQCGLFIERRAGCNHMDCRCGHSFCWLCLLPLSERCGCPQFGGRRTPDARARLSSSGWRRSVLLAADAASLRALACAMAVGVGLHHTDDLARGLSALAAAARAAPLPSQLFCAQAFLGAVQLLLARSCLNALPRRIHLHVAVRQLDLAFGGAGTHGLLGVLKWLERHELLHPRDPARPAASLPRRILASAVSLALAPSRRVPPVSRAPGTAQQLVRLHPSVADRPPRAPHRPPGEPGARPFHEHRPFASTSNAQGYTLTRRCRAALPALAALAYACEVMLPALAPRLIALVLYGASSLLLAPLGGATRLLCALKAAVAASPHLPCQLAHALGLPSLAAYVCGGATLLVVLGVSTVLSFIGNVTILISLLSTLRETGVRRRVYHRMEADPEAELEEVVEDGELIYPIEELRLDVVRVLLDGRTLLFYAAAYLHMASFSEALWGAFAECLGGVGLPDPYLVRGGGWSHAAGGAEAEAAGEAGGVVVVGGGIGGVGDAGGGGGGGGGGIRGGGWDVNPFSWVWGMHLPAAVVCLNALVAHLEPVASAWCSEWTGRYLTPSGELLSRGFELLRLYGYVALLCPAAFVALLACLMPQWLAAWAASGAPRAYIPTAEQGLTALLHLTMLVDAGAIVFALASFRMPRGKAKLCAVAAATAGLAALAATDTLHAARHAHRAALLAVVPPFTVLVLTLTPVLWPAAPAPRAAAAAAAGGGGGGPRDDEDEDDESRDEEGAGSGSDYEDSEWSDLS